MGALDGLLVVAVEHAVAAPYASCKLADAGARVIKVERPEGDFARGYDALVMGQSAYFVWLNRGKESVCLNLKSEADADVLQGLLAQADILIQNLGPGVLDSLGFGAEALQTTNPRLIICNISGYGTEGPRRDQKAYDLLIQAESGLCAINGTPEGPARVGVSVCDIAAGMTAYQAILEALITRAKTAKGQIIDVSLFHAMADWMNVPYLQKRYGDFTPQRIGLRHPSIVPYGAFDCADGKVVLFSIQNEREWTTLCDQVFGAPEMATAPGFGSATERVANRATVDAWCAAQIIQHDREANITRLSAARIACGRLSDLDDLLTHPQNRLITVQTAAGPVDMLAPGSMVRGAAPEYGKVPAKDEGGAAVRATYGRAAR